MMKTFGSFREETCQARRALLAHVCNAAFPWAWLWGAFKPAAGLAEMIWGSGSRIWGKLPG